MSEEKGESVEPNIPEQTAGRERSDFPKAVLRRLSAAQGWLSLGDWQEAREEIRGIESPYAEFSVVLAFRVEIYRAALNWAEMAELSEILCQREPEEAGHWLNYSYGSRRSVGLEKARDILIRARDLFSKDALIRFNLACYEAQLGRLEEARKYLAEAIALKASWREAAKKDLDLEALWPEL